MQFKKQNYLLVMLMFSMIFSSCLTFPFNKNRVVIPDSFNGTWFNNNTNDTYKVKKVTPYKARVFNSDTQEASYFTLHKINDVYLFHYQGSYRAVPIIEFSDTEIALFKFKVLSEAEKKLSDGVKENIVLDRLKQGNYTLEELHSNYTKVY